MFKIIIQQIRSFTNTLFCFCVACILVPFLVLSFICVHLSNKFWINCLSSKYPMYEFSKSKKIRSLIDTTRNAAIFHFLLEINGHCDFEKIKQQYINFFIERRNKTGELRFPKLRKKLISHWGTYAWVKDDSDFNVNNHIVLSSKTYRGRPVNENNLQEFLSDLITKYLPPEIPPWQVIVIHNSAGASSSPAENEQQINEDEKYYILVRIHHLLLAEENNLHVSELLMLNSDKSSVQVYDNLIESPKLANFIKKPVHIPNLWNHVMITASNQWNEFIYRYDPVESSDINKRREKIECLSQLISISFITMVTIILNFIKGYQKTNNQIKYKFKYFINLCKRETYKRNLTTQSIIDSILFSLNPFNIIKNLIQICWWLTITRLLLWPYYIYCEIYSLKELIFTGYAGTKNTLVGFLSVYFPLVYHANIELFEIISEIIYTPRNVYEELFVHRSKEGNILQIKSYCGRKVISFSKSIDMKPIREKLNLVEGGETEFLLACLGGSLHNYLQEFRDHRIPSLLNVTCRLIEKGYFIEKYDKTAHIGGVVFLQLPLQQPSKEQMICIRSIIERVRRKQIAVYLIAVGQVKFDLLTSIFPEVWMKVFINYFSINFPVTITEIHGDSSTMEMNWGHQVKDLLFFRPPQSKTCLSLNLHRFGNKSRLSVMADTQLAPEHNKISNCWEDYVETVVL